MSKYQEYYQEMIDANRGLFDHFMDLHDRYQKDPNRYQTEFNEEGQKVMDVIRDWEGKLCGKSERSNYGTYSPKLAQKFWELVRADFPKIDFVGVSSV